MFENLSVLERLQLVFMLLLMLLPAFVPFLVVVFAVANLALSRVGLDVDTAFGPVRSATSSLRSATTEELAAALAELDSCSEISIT